MSEPAIRPATLADAAAFAAIYRPEVLAGTATFELDPPDAAEMGRRLTERLAAGFPWLAAEQDGLVAGYAYVGPYRARPAYRYAVEDSIYLLPEARGRGLGRRLLDRLVAECAARGYRQLVGIVGNSANAASVRLHLAAGFTMVGTLRAVGWKHGRWLDTVILQRALGAGAGTPPA